MGFDWSLGTGTAEKARKDLQDRKRRIEEAVDGKKPQPKPAPKKSK